MSLILMNDTVISSRIRLARNIRNLPLPYKLRETYSAEASGFFGKLVSDMRKLGFRVRCINEMTETERLSLIERHLISRDLSPESRFSAVALNETDDISVMINEEDHIRSQCIMEGLRLNRAYERLNVLDDFFIKHYDIAFDDRYGFLTRCLTNAGTGMRASVMVFLPALTITGEIRGVFEKLEGESITVRGAYGEGTKAVSYLYQISNRHTLGLTEDEIIRSVSEAVSLVAEQEKRCSERLLASDTLALKDRIMRSLGTLLYACTLSLSEFITCFCNVKMGVGIGYIELVSDNRFNAMIDKAQDATLSLISGYPPDSEEIKEVRAEKVSKWLKESLKIE